MRTFALVAYLAVIAFSGQSAASTVWNACSAAQDGTGYMSLKSDTYSHTLQVESSCREMTLEQVQKKHPAIAAKHRHEWESVWNIMRFPALMIEYRLSLYAFDNNVEILGQDSYGIFRFQNSPYTRINESFVFSVPRCSKMTISFLSPWPPNRYALTFSSGHTHREEWRLHKVELVVPLPDARTGNPAAAATMYYAVETNLERVLDDDLIKKCNNK